MWLGKLFGARKREPEIDLDEEPARFTAPAANETGAHANLKRSVREAPIKPAAGFDPYNSGTFKKKDNAWERVGRR